MMASSRQDVKLVHSQSARQWPMIVPAMSVWGTSCADSSPQFNGEVGSCEDGETRLLNLLWLLEYLSSDCCNADEGNLHAPICCIRSSSNGMMAELDSLTTATVVSLCQDTQHEHTLDVRTKQLGTSHCHRTAD